MSNEGVKVLDNAFGTYAWFPEDGLEFNHPDDLSRLLISNGKVYFCAGQINDYLLLQDINGPYRVKPKLFKPLPNIGFKFGDKVKLIESPELEVTIDDILWHYNKNESMFLVSIQEKKKSKICWIDDFIKD